MCPRQWSGRRLRNRNRISLSPQHPDHDPLRWSPSHQLHKLRCGRLHGEPSDPSKREGCSYHNRAGRDKHSHHHLHRDCLIHQGSNKRRRRHNHYSNRLRIRFLHGRYCDLGRLRVDHQPNPPYNRREGLLHSNSYGPQWRPSNPYYIVQRWYRNGKPNLYYNQRYRAKPCFRLNRDSRIGLRKRVPLLEHHHDHVQRSTRSDHPRINH